MPVSHITAKNRKEALKEAKDRVGPNYVVKLRKATVSTEYIYEYQPKKRR